MEEREAVDSRGWVGLQEEGDGKWREVWLGWGSGTVRYQKEGEKRERSGKWKDEGLDFL